MERSTKEIAEELSRTAYLVEKGWETIRTTFANALAHAEHRKDDNVCLPRQEFSVLADLIDHAVILAGLAGELRTNMGIPSPLEQLQRNDDWWEADGV